MRLRNLLLRWLLVPLAVLWAVGFGIQYARSIDQANQAYDRTLLGSALTMAERVSVRDGRLSADVPYAALEMLGTEAHDRIFYRISATAEPRMSTGYADLPKPPVLPANETPVFYDARYLDEAVRLVAVLKPMYESPVGSLLVQVAETTAGRAALSRRILVDSALTQLALIGAVALLIVFAVRRGLEPLRRIRDEVELRSETDLTPIDDRAVPLEVVPLVEAINAHTERQRRLNEAQQQFIADASHQLKTPLTVLRMQASLALAQRDPNLMRRIVEDIHESTDATSRMIQQLLALARSEHDLAAPDEPVDVVEIARTATFDLLPQALKKSIDIGFEAENRAPLACNPLLLRELVSNLVDNAVRYAPVGGHVTVSVRHEASSGDVHIVVEDDGPGIPPQDRAKVFARFYRVNGSPGDGTGLGLAIVKQIAERHGGTVVVDDGADGVGTRITVRLPGAVRSTGSGGVKDSLNKQP